MSRLRSRRIDVWVARGGVSLFGVGLVTDLGWIQYLGLSLVAIALLTQGVKKLL